ncbi:MAG: pyroglutamyl-peptidase I [Erysipelotrichia bacterium]|nr:pyroglutamyl-peptidase I [Erysipelotrichia bacterium]NCC54049.1 pyroglutamyl-peptidase I [Erysipelotrichia bacterium]
MKVLVSGFTPFGEEVINPSSEVVKRLPDQICGFSIIKATITTAAPTCEKEILALIEKHQPDFVLNIGQAKGRKQVSLERIAMNLDDFSMADNEGNQYVNQLIKEDGADGYFSNLPLQAIIKAVHGEKLEATISNTAGTFVCNHLMYCVQYAIRHHYTNMKAGFVHIPCLPQQVVDGECPSMELERILEVLVCMIAHLNDEEENVGLGCVC